jgi:hypothetical protein
MSFLLPRPSLSPPLFCVACTPERPIPDGRSPRYPHELPRVLCGGHLVLVWALKLAVPTRPLWELIEGEISRTRALLAAWPPRDWNGRLVVLERECRTLHWALTEGFERAESAAELRIIRDRRRGDRRKPSPVRRSDRRRPPPSSWAALGVVVVTSLVEAGRPAPLIGEDSQWNTGRVRDHGTGDHSRLAAGPHRNPAI